MLVRPARVDETLSVARVHVRSWQAAYRGFMPDEYLDALRPEDRAARYDFSGLRPDAPSTLVAVEGDDVIGFSTFGPNADDAAGLTGDVLALYVDPDKWGCGAGRALIAETRTRFIARGYTRAVLWVLVGNARAERFYERDGWARTGVRRTARVWGIDVDESQFETRLAVKGRRSR